MADCFIYLTNQMLNYILHCCNPMPCGNKISSHYFEKLVLRWIFIYQICLFYF